MPLKPIKQMITEAKRDGYAIGYFESWNLESLQGIIDAAEESHSPIIIGFNGDFLSNQKRLIPERIELYGAMGKAAAQLAKVPVGFIFNECDDDGCVVRAIDSGFNLVMPCDPHASYEESVKRIKQICKYAHNKEVAVEAEIGELPCGASGVVEESGAAMTDPEIAEKFVKETGIDLLSVSVGNVHIMLNGQRGLDLEQLEKISKMVNIPLGLHGGTGIETKSLQAAIKLGVTKIAFGTYLKQRYLEVIRKKLSDNCPDPHRLLGMGGVQDIMTAGRIAVKEAVLERIELLGCTGRA